MKKFSFLAVIAALAIASTSCVKKADYEALKAQYEEVSENYDEVLDLLNAIEAGFQEIRLMENQIIGSVRDSEMTTKEKKAEMLNDLENIKAMLQQNREKVDKLQAQLDASRRNNGALQATIKRLKDELAQKNDLIAMLEATISQQDTKIKELDATIKVKDGEISQLNETTAQQKVTIKEQDETINTVWYTMKTSKDLKLVYKIKSGGVNLSENYNKAEFTQADLRNIKSLPLNTKKAILVSAHPVGSFTLDKGDDKMMTLNITDPQKFWSASRYLIIRVK